MPEPHLVIKFRVEILFTSNEAFVEHMSTMLHTAPSDQGVCHEKFPLTSL